MRGNTQNDAEDKRDKREEKLKRIRRDIDAQLRITGDTDVIEQDVANHFDISRAEARSL